MTPGQLQTIEEIFHAALQRDTAEVGSFLDSACAGDKLVRGEVVTLLASHQHAGNFIETPAIGLAAQILQRSSSAQLAGQRIGHYELGERIGAGGMGEVYLATDIVAGRKAALKLLPARFTGDAERLQRFEQEARAVVGLNHPNILTVYEIGEDRSIHYIASELIDGETLRQRLGRGPMQVTEALEVALQVASALVAAHLAGIVHRDIKPENIMIRPDGYVKVLDFGIAKLAEKETPVPAGGEDGALAATRLGSTFGTARYMSPEQMLGEAIDQRSDIWSLGVVLYEMIAGRAPFSGDSPGEILKSILTTKPPPLTNAAAQIPAELDRIIQSTLRKERDERCKNACELLEALKGVRRRMESRAESELSSAPPILRRRKRAAVALVFAGLAMALALPLYWNRNPGTNPPPVKSIAVLPFENLSADQENDYFAAGVQDEIFSDLARIADLKVISRTSTRQYEAKPRNLRQIGQELGVAHLLEGSVQRTGNRLRIHAQLIDARTDAHVWAQTYDRDVADLFAIQSEIARTIATQLQAKISERESAAIAQPATSDLMANDLYLEALALESQQPDQAGVLKAIRLLEQAVARDPNFFLAYCALAEMHLYSYGFGTDHTPARLEMADAAIQNAAKIAPDHGELHLIRAQYLGLTMRDYDRARAELELARRALPNNAAVYFQTGVIDRRQGRWTEAVRNFERAVELDPRNPDTLVETASTYSSMRRYQEAAQLCRRVLAVAPHNYNARIGAVAQLFLERAQLRPLRDELNAILAENPGAAPVIADPLFECAILERDAAAGDRALAAIPPAGLPLRPNLMGPREWYAGLLARIFHRPEIALAAFATTRDILKKQLAEQPDNASAWSMLGRVEAALGRKEEAIKAGRRACELLPVSREATSGVIPLTDLARIYAWVGEKDLALQHLATSAKSNLGVSYGHLKLDPSWDTLRGDPRFEQIVASLAPKL